MVENFIVIQLTFAEKFVPQDFTIMTNSGLSGPANTCAMQSASIDQSYYATTKNTIIWAKYSQLGISYPYLDITQLGIT